MKPKVLQPVPRRSSTVRVEERQELFAARMARLGTENAFKIGPYIKEVEDQGQRVVKCNLGEPDFPLPKHIGEEVKRQIDNDLTHYCDPQGILPLREAIARDVGARRGFEVTPDRVVVFAGGKPPIGFCQQAYCDPGDEVVYPSPGYPIYESFTRFVDAVPRPLQLEEKEGFCFTGTQLAPLVSRRTKLVFLNFPSNPTGGVASRRDLEGIADVFQRKAPPQARLYSDEMYEAILFDGARHESIASVPGMEKRTIIVSGASKTYSWTGGRVGWAVFPSAEEAAAFKNLNINVYSCLPAYNQMGAKLAIESPESPPEIARMVAAFQERRDFVVQALRAIRGVTCQLPRGAFYVFPNVGGVCKTLGALDAWGRLPAGVRKRSSPATLFQLFLLFRYQVATMDRRSFGAIGAEGRHYLRISVATGLDDLKLAVSRIGEAAHDRAGFADFLKEGRFF